MAVFEDNTAVTLTDLNNIAVDLGATTFSAFSEKKFGVDELNRITADLVGKGILTSGERCVPEVIDGKVYIHSGVIVFGSGAKIRIEEESTVEVVAAAGDYIYAFNDVTTGKASIIASADMPTSGDYVMLAQLDDAGTVVDMREMSVANLTLSAELQNNYAEQTVKFSMMDRDEISVVPSLPQCKYIILTSCDWGECKPGSYTWWYPVELTENYTTLFYDTGSSISHQVYVKKVDGLLYFICYVNSGSNALYGNISFILA